MAGKPPRPEELDPSQLHDEFWPTPVPPLVDQDPPDWQEVAAGFISVPSAAVPPEVSDDEVRAAVASASSDGQVLELLGGPPTSELSTGLVERKDGEPPLVLVTLLRCPGSKVVLAWVDTSTSAVVRVEQADASASPTPTEIERAVELATLELGSRLETGLEGRGMTIAGSGASAGRRLIDVRFVQPEERQARGYAIIDVCDDQVIDSGTV